MSMWNAIVAGRRAAAVLLELLRRWCPAAEGRSPRQVSAGRFGWSSTTGWIDTRKNRNFKIPLSVARRGAFFRCRGAQIPRSFRLSSGTQNISARYRNALIRSHLPALTRTDRHSAPHRFWRIFRARRGNPSAGQQPHTHAPSSFSQRAAALPGGVRICLRPGVPALPRGIVLGAGFDPAFAPSEPHQGGGMTILAPGGTLIWRRRCSRWASQTALAKATNAPSMTRLKERARWPRTARNA